VSGFLVPTPVGGTATGWAVVDWLDNSYSSQPAAAGVATLQLPQLDPAVMWALSHMVCSSTSTSSTQLRLYLDSVGPQRFRDGSDRGNFDVADWPAPGLLVPRGSALVAQWTGCSAGAVGTLTVQGQIMRQVAA
jgi:hypothetical protein